MADKQQADKQQSPVRGGRRKTFGLRDTGGLQQRFASADKNKGKQEMEGEVVVGCRLYALRDLSHDTHTFKASFRCFYDWIDPHLASLLQERGSAIDEAEWSKRIPEMSFTNASTLEPEPWTHAPRVIDAATGRIYTHRRYEGTFNERFEMQEFPFDTQTLRIRMQLSKSMFRAHCVRLLPLEVRSMPHIPGWSLVMPRSAGMTEEQEAAARKAKATVSVSLHVRREAGFFVRCIISMQALLTSLSFVSFTLFIDGLWDRVEFQLALIFGLVALRFSAGNAIPVVPYLTTLDAYQNACIIMLVLLALVQGCIFGAFRRFLEASVTEGITLEHERMFNTLDLCLASGGFVLWVLFNLFFFGRTRRRMDDIQLMPTNGGAEGAGEINWTGVYTEKDHNPPWAKANAPDGPPRFFRGGSMEGSAEYVVDPGLLLTAAGEHDTSSQAAALQNLAPSASKPPVRMDPGRNNTPALESLGLVVPVPPAKVGPAKVAPAPGAE